MAKDMMYVSFTAVFIGGDYTTQYMYYIIDTSYII